MPVYIRQAVAAAGDPDIPRVVASLGEPVQKLSGSCRAVDLYRRGSRPAGHRSRGESLDKAGRGWVVRHARSAA